MIKKSGNHNHPPKGAAIKVQPIRDSMHINAIKALLEDQPRNLCLFTLGINTAYRANELLSLSIGQVSVLTVGGGLDVRQSKNGEYRNVTINNSCFKVIQYWLKHHPYKYSVDAPLFLSQKTYAPLSVSSLNRLVKGWCKNVGVKENMGTHSLRKTWGYHQRMHVGAPLYLLMKAYGHSSEAQTLEYLGIQCDEVRALYLELEL